MNTDRPWLFDLRRFDEDPQPPADDPGNPDPEPEPEPDPDTASDLGDKGKKALDAMKVERNQARRELAELRRQQTEQAKKLAEFEDRDKSESEKLAARAEKAEARAKAADARTVKAEVKALAADAFADPTDADLLGDLSKYVSDDGIDIESIQADLDALLDRKPHLRKQAAAIPKKQPKPDPSQGPRKEPEPVDFRTSDKASFEAALAELGVRPR
ncbi:hypothetical protein AB0J63_26610 [Streptosporangium canum]|uniref:hypothetical protein n=1 Tax=Streptosporangium canum TaxID=324952 RepID=UPI0034325450